MKNLILLFSYLLLCTACKTQVEQKKETSTSKISLNGDWQFLASNTISEGKVLKENYVSWDKLTVPGNWDTENAYANFVGNGYYQKEINIPNNWKEKQIRLHFEAVYETAKVWLNGKFLGIHKGGYTPFEFNITDKAILGKKNSILVQANNSYKRGAWWGWGGISRSVSLIANENVRMKFQHISAIPNFETQKIQFKILYHFENNASKKERVKVLTNIKDANGTTLFSKEIEIDTKANTTSDKSISFEKNLNEFDLWHFDTPTLYQLESELVSHNKKQTITDKFGVRKVAIKSEQFFLNNEPVRLNGFNRVHDHPVYGNSEPYELVKHDITEMKSLGANFSRMMHAPAAPNLLRFCDSIGYLLITEIPVWGADDPNAFPNNTVTKTWLKEMIERDFNHASVVGYSVGNELGAFVLKEGIEPIVGIETAVKNWSDKTMTPNQYEYANSMLDYIDELDTTRLKTFASYTSYLPKSKIGNEVYEKVDFLSINTYGKAVDKAEKTHQKFPNKPIFFTEIGKGQLGETNDSEFSKSLLDDLSGIQKLPYVMGSSVWTYNDYRSNYKATPASGNRAWGVVDVWRNRKPKAFNQVQNMYAPVSNLTHKIDKDKIEVILTPRGLNELPNYTLRNYSITCTFYGKFNKEISQQNNIITEITPGSDQITINFKNDPNANFYKIALVSPQGIEMKKVFSNERNDLFKNQDLSDRIIYLKKYRNHIIIGYNVSKHESSFVFQYGNTAEKLDQTYKSELKGFVKIPWNKNAPIFIKMKADNSSWSKIKNLR